MWRWRWSLQSRDDGRGVWLCHGGGVVSPVGAAGQRRLHHQGTQLVGLAKRVKTVYRHLARFSKTKGWRERRGTKKVSFLTRPFFVVSVS